MVNYNSHQAKLRLVLASQLWVLLGLGLLVWVLFGLARPVVVFANTGGGGPIGAPPPFIPPPTNNRFLRFPPGAPSNIFPSTTPSPDTTPTFMITELCPSANDCMPSRSTIASLYVPRYLQSINPNGRYELVIIDGCDNSLADNNPGSITYYIINGQVINSKDPQCNGSNFDIRVFLTANPTTEQQGAYDVYDFIAVMSGPGDADPVGAVMYNLFRLQAINTEMRIGVSAKPVFCDTHNSVGVVAYANSCPSLTDIAGNPPPPAGFTYSFSSFGQVKDATANGGSYSQYIEIPAQTLKCYGVIDVFDLDANIYGQNGITATLYDTNVAANSTTTVSAPISNNNYPFGFPGMFYGTGAYGNGNNQHLYFPNPANAADKYLFMPGHKYKLLISGLTRTNTLQVYMGWSRNKDGTGGTNCSPDPVCKILSVFSLTNTVDPTVIQPGDNIGFTASVTNAEGYTLGVNGSAWGDEYPNPLTGAPTTDIVNSLLPTVPATNYFRAGAPIADNDPDRSSQIITINDSNPVTMSSGPGSPLGTFVLKAPLTSQTGVRFDWGLVMPDVGWLDVTCKGTFNVAEPPAILSCAVGESTPSPSFAEAGSIADISIALHNSGKGSLQGAVVSMSIFGLPFSVVSLGAIPANGWGVTSSISASLPQGLSSVPVTWKVVGNFAPSGNITCLGAISLFSRPYLKIFGGDARAGSEFTRANGSCSLPAVGRGISAWGELNGGGWRGASAEYAVIASGVINGFASAGLRAATPTAENNGLTFANSPTVGNFGASSCMPNYWQMLHNDTPTPGQIEWPANAANCSLIWPDNLRFDKSSPGCWWFNPGVLPAGTRQTNFVDGDMAIGGNISYAQNWTTVDDIPNITYVVCGNIYIDKSVDTISGWYIAMPRNYCSSNSESDDKGGKIYTCTNTFLAVPKDANYYDKCKTPLTIRGNLTARTIKFQRTTGSLRAGSIRESITSTNIAEKFISDPSSWIVSPVQRQTDINTSSTKLDGISGLPPVL